MRDAVEVARECGLPTYEYDYELRAFAASIRSDLLEEAATLCEQEHGTASMAAKKLRAMKEK